jgi:replicative DNA helicase Mcm
MDEIKEAAVAMLFGGVDKIYPDGFATRGQPNVLVVGDPGVAKSQILRYVQGIAPRGLYTSGKGSSAAGLCVAADSNVFLNNSITSISELIEPQFQTSSVIQYKEGIDYVNNRNTKLETLHSQNLKIKRQKIEKFWRIKSPNKLIRIKARTGRELKLTPETTIFSLEPELGLVWKQAGYLRKGERIAAVRKLPFVPTNIPKMKDLISDYPSRITLLNMEKAVQTLLDRIREIKSITFKEISKTIGVSQDAPYRWKSKSRIGNISLIHFKKLCELADSTISDQLTDNLSLQINHGKTIYLPKQLNPEWFYIMGLAIGDGRISTANHAGSWGGVSIGLSNDDPQLLDIFSTFFGKLGLNPNLTPKSQERSAEVRVHSKFIYYIFSQFGLTPSPKSCKIAPKSEILSYPDDYLTQFLKGLFDSDGWIYLRNEGGTGSNHIGYSTISKNLAEFVQNALLKFGIISYIRERPPGKSVRSDGQVIESKYTKYELTFCQFESFKIFKEKIGFNHEARLEKLERYCKQSKIPHSNTDTIPNINHNVRELINFYGQTSREITGRKSSFAPSLDSTGYSYNRLAQVLKKLNLDWLNHRRYIEYERRNLIYHDLAECYSDYEIAILLNISPTNVHEYFKRKGRHPRIPARCLKTIFDSAKASLSNSNLEFIENLIEEIQLLDREYKKKYQFLEQICNSDIFWDEIKEVEVIESEEEFVYDLTIPSTHNFIVNGFVVHNTAAIMRDPDTGEVTLEAGALVLADRGVCLIDEFDKMNENDRSAIHEAMEQHTVSVAKAGIVATLNARTGVLAAANPKYGRYEPQRTFSENVNLSPAILSRFDLVFILRDEPDEKHDAVLASHILKLHRFHGTAQVSKPPLTEDQLKKYFSYAKSHYNPILTEEASELIEDFYVSMRNIYAHADSSQAGDRVTITARQLEGIIRLSEARARAALRNQVTKQDAQNAIDLMKYSLNQIATDPDTGYADIDAFYTGQTGTRRSKLTKLLSIIDFLYRDAGGKFKEELLYDEAEREGLGKEYAKGAIQQMRRDGTLYQPQAGWLDKP